MKPEIVTGWDKRLDMNLQYDSALNVSMRFNVYKHAIDHKPTIHDQIVENLKLNGNETIVDLACGDGSVLLNIRKNRQHKGRLIGIELDDFVFAKSEMAVQKENLQPIDFMVADALSTGLENDSADIAMSLFALYHMPMNTALWEARRILKPGGQFIATTAGKNNKLKHRQLERETAAYLGVEPPTVFTETCNDKGLADILPKYFTNIEHYAQRTNMRIYEKNVEDYLHSLQSMASACTPPLGGEWRRGLEKIALPKIMAEIQDTGYFEDTIDRHVFYAQKPTM